MSGPVCPSEPRYCATTGFTLLELLVVLAIASLILSLVPIAFSGSVDLVRSKRVARELVATLQHARSHAIARNRIVDVTLDGGAGRYAVDAQGVIHEMPQGVRLTLIELYGREVESERGHIRFFPDGSSSGAQLRLDDGRRRYLIAVHWLLGRIDVTRGASS